jgi:hypothetical protein
MHKVKVIVSNITCDKRYLNVVNEYFQLIEQKTSLDLDTVASVYLVRTKDLLIFKEVYLNLLKYAGVDLTRIYINFFLEE